MCFTSSFFIENMTSIHAASLQQLVLWQHWATLRCTASSRSWTNLHAAEQFFTQLNNSSICYKVKYTVAAKLTEAILTFNSMVVTYFTSWVHKAVMNKWVYFNYYSPSRLKRQQRMSNQNGSRVLDGWSEPDRKYVLTLQADFTPGLRCKMRLQIAGTDRIERTLAQDPIRVVSCWVSGQRIKAVVQVGQRDDGIDLIWMLTVMYGRIIVRIILQGLRGIEEELVSRPATCLLFKFGCRDKKKTQFAWDSVRTGFSASTGTPPPYRLSSNKWHWVKLIAKSTNRDGCERLEFAFATAGSSSLCNVAAPSCASNVPSGLGTRAFCSGFTAGTELPCLGNVVQICTYWTKMLNDFRTWTRSRAPAPAKQLPVATYNAQSEYSLDDLHRTWAAVDARMFCVFAFILKRMGALETGFSTQMKPSAMFKLFSRMKFLISSTSSIVISLVPLSSHAILARSTVVWCWLKYQWSRPTVTESTIPTQKGTDENTKHCPNIKWWVRTRWELSLAQLLCPLPPQISLPKEYLEALSLNFRTGSSRKLLPSLSATSISFFASKARRLVFFPGRAKPWLFHVWRLCPQTSPLTKWHWNGQHDAIADQLERQHKNKTELCSRSRYDLATQCYMF